jgi:hypothetical protein
MLTVARHGRAWRLTGVPVFLSYGGRFPMRFAMEFNNDEAARLASGIDVCGLRRCPDLKNRMKTFLVTSACPLTDPIASGDDG